MQAVKIIHNPRIIRMLADPVRSEILRLTTMRPMTETQLAKKLSLAKPSIWHHLKILQNATLIKIEKIKPGKHGILEKYYKPQAALFIEDWGQLSLKLKRRFIPRKIQLLKGMLSAIEYVKGKENEPIEISSETLEELAQELAKKILNAARKYEGQELAVDVDGEMLQIEIYTEALEELAKKKKWQNIFHHDSSNV